MVPTHTPAAHETGAFEYADVLRNRVERHRKRLREFCDARLSLRKALQDRPPRRVSERSQRPVYIGLRCQSSHNSTYRFNITRAGRGVKTTFNLEVECRLDEWRANFAF